MIKDNDLKTLHRKLKIEQHEPTEYVTELSEKIVKQ